MPKLSSLFNSPFSENTKSYLLHSPSYFRRHLKRRPRHTSDDSSPSIFLFSFTIQLFVSFLPNILFFAIFSFCVLIFPRRLIRTMKNLDRTIENVARYASTPISESPSSSSSSSDGEENPTHMLGPDMWSYMNENSLTDFVKKNFLIDICNFVPNPHCKIGDPSIGGTGFYARVIEEGVGLPIHPFFVMSSIPIGSRLGS